MTGSHKQLRFSEPGEGADDRSSERRLSQRQVERPAWAGPKPETAIVLGEEEGVAGGDWPSAGGRNSRKSLADNPELVLALARELSVREQKKNSRKSLIVPLPSLPKLAENRSGSIRIKGLDLEARKILEKFDADGDGYVDTEELGLVVQELVRTKFKGRFYLWGLVAIAFALVMIIGCGFGLTWAVFLANKDTSVKNNVWVARGTDDPLKTASSSYTVRNNVMVPRGGSASSRLAISTATHTRRVPLAANVTAADLASLTRVHLKSSSGAEAAFLVAGFQQQAEQIYLSGLYGTVVVKQGQVVSTSGRLASILGDFTWNEVTGIITPPS